MEVASQSGLTLPGQGGPAAARGYAAGATRSSPTTRPRPTSCSTRPATQGGRTASGTNPDGSPLDITFSVQAGWIDYEAIADEVSPTSATLGADHQGEQDPARTSVDQQKKTGDFQLMINFMDGRLRLRQRHRRDAASSRQIPTKTEVKGNVERFSDPDVDAAVIGADRSHRPGSETKELVGVLVNTMMTQYPVIADLLRPGPQHLPHRQGGGLAERGGSRTRTRRTTARWMLTHLTAPK